MREGRKTAFARHLRRTMTDAERLLWHHLRNRALVGFKFRRQHPLGPYIVGFVCLQRSLVVELDGSQHLQPGFDRHRDAFLAQCRYRVLRFWDNEALSHPQAVLAVILDALNVSLPVAEPQAGERA
ncbi:DNA methyltransferase [Pseudoxanthomonas kalamensis DSM 18571]|uniref:endonuclease domain-containing protein n=1 Tax=Pseudoxanthomonas kalamensis TaxID=289483 RepID=UPI001391E283|nr:DNA methyltransferase [Pseudoxanthomonas kalamensis DSM 18571]